MGLGKLQDHGMNALEIFLLTMVLGLTRQIPLFFTRRMDKDLVECQIYVDDIIFGSTNNFFVMSLASL
jgi:hypothetical protein